VSDPLHPGIYLPVEVVGDAVGAAAPQEDSQRGEEEYIYWWLSAASDNCRAKADEGEQDGFAGFQHLDIVKY